MTETKKAGWRLFGRRRAQGQPTESATEFAGKKTGTQTGRESKMGRLSGKIAIVTGAGSGIGQACAEVFAKEGAKVACVNRTQSKSDAVAASIEKAGGTAISLGADVSVEAECEAAIKATVDHFGRVDILVNGAGVGYSWGEKSPGSMNPVDTTPTDKWHEVMGINLHSLYYMSKHTIPHMKAAGGGSIIHVASVVGLVGLADAHAYCTAKGAIINLARSMALAYADDKIRTNALCPGFTETPMIESVMSVFDDPASAKALSPMGRAGTPDEMAYGALYLASDESSYTTGIALPIDGGTLAKV
ncbi:MAG: SDR family NAD(P)-dependent oxidoreductase [Pseudomonadota bacterium]